MKRKKMFPVMGKASLCRACPDCGTEFKHKNVIEHFLNYCYCEKCKDIVEIKLPKKKDNSSNPLPSGTTN